MKIIMTIFATWSMYKQLSEAREKHKEEILTYNHDTFYFPGWIEQLGVFQ